MNFDVTILGSSSAVHAYGRYPTAQVIHYNAQPYLIDCGEGTQFRLSLFKIKVSRINQIFISHLHGDHYYGLIGLLSSMNLNGRKDKLTIFAPEGIQEILQVNFQYSQSELRYPLECVVLDTSKFEVIFEDNHVKVSTIPLNHKIPTCGFLFKEQPKLKKIIKEKIEQYQIEGEKILEIKGGADFTTSDGRVIPNDELTIPAAPARTYAYCSDTIYTEDILPYISEVDLLYHEATYREAEIEKAKEYHHSTAKEAGSIAQKARAKELLIGHFSSRYDLLDMLLEEAKSVFPNVRLAIEGETFSISTTS